MQNIGRHYRRIKRQRVARRYLWSEHYLSSQSLFKALKQYITTLDGKILDLGCGNQPYREWFSKDAQVMGLDPDILDSQPDIAALAENLPFNASSFDAVFCAQTLEHVPEPWTVFQEIVRVLKPGGRLILSAPQAWRVHEPPHDYYRYTKYGLTYLAKKYGLVVDKVLPLNTVWAVVGQSLLNILPHNRLFYTTAPLNLVVNLLFVPLDRVWPGRRETIDNLLIAHKPEGKFA